MNENKKSLIAVQGAAQFIAGYIASQWCQERIWFEKNDITLLIYETFVPAENEILFQNTIKEIANIVKIEKIVFINQIDSNQLSKMHYKKSILKLKSIIEQQSFDYLFLARDFGSFITKLIPNTYPQAVKVEYGDSFGLVGNEKYLDLSILQIFKKPVSSLKVISKIIIYGHYHKKIPFDYSVITMPLVWDSKYLIDKKLLIPEMNFVKEIFYQISVQLTQLNNYCKSLINNSSECKLYLLTNLHNSGACTFENELAMYEEIILKTAKNGQTIIIKNHPRGSDEMLNQLNERLRNSFDIQLINDKKYSFIPIELWSTIMNNCEIFPVYSTSSIALKYLFSKSVILTLDAKMIDKYLYSDKKKFVNEGVQMIEMAINKLENWDCNSPLWIKI
jgi:hypothetical protein